MRDILQRFAFSGYPEDYLHDAARHHRARGDQVPDGEPRGVGAVSDQVPVQDGPECPEGLRNGEEHRDRLRPHLQREDLADCQVGRTGTRGREEEDHAPRDRLGGGSQHVLIEQDRGHGEHHAGTDVGPGDHLLPADRVEEAPDRQRAEQVTDRENDQVQGSVRRLDVVEPREHQGVGEEDRVVQEGLGDHQRST